jgi:glutathione S-transferase
VHFSPGSFTTKGEEPDIAKAKDTWANTLPPMSAILIGFRYAAFYAENTLPSIAGGFGHVLMQIALVAEMPLNDYPALATHYELMIARPIAGFRAAPIIRKARSGLT